MSGPLREVGHRPPDLAQTLATDGLASQGDMEGSPVDTGRAAAVQTSAIERLQSPLEHLLAGADTLARFRDAPIDPPPAPVSRPGDLARRGDVQADAGAHVPGHTAARAPDASVRATIPSAGVEARLSVAGATATQRPWVSAALVVREPGRIDRANVGLRLIGEPAATQTGPSLPARLTSSGYVAANGPPSTGALTVRGAILEISAPGGRTVLLATSDGAGLLRTGPEQGAAAVYVRSASSASTGSPGIGFAEIALGASSLAGLLAALGDGEARESALLLRPDGASTAFPPLTGHRSRWAELERRLSHDAARIVRLEAVLYDIAAARFAALGIDLPRRAAALRDVVWALAVEHGPWPAPDGSDPISRLSSGPTLADLDDRELIAGLFDEQARRDPDGGLIHYPELVDDAARAAVLDRLAAERRIALDRLAGQT